jgi:preprotein translocase subunit SecG
MNKKTYILIFFYIATILCIDICAQNKEEEIEGQILAIKKMRASRRQEEKDQKKFSQKRKIPQKEFIPKKISK